MSTKSDRIRALYAEGKSVAEIADVVGCLPEYVRVVRQRSNGRSNADINYLPRLRAREKALRSYGDREAARTAARAAYREARKRGESITTANNKYGGTYSHTMWKTGRMFIREAAE